MMPEQAETSARHPSCPLAPQRGERAGVRGAGSESVAENPFTLTLSPLQGARGILLALAFLLLAALPSRAAEQPSAEAIAKAREVVAASMVPGSQEQMIGGIAASIGQLILSVNPGHEADRKSTRLNSSH